MAYPTPALDLPLHTDLGLMAQRRCRLLRQAHQPAPQTWRIPISRGARNRHRALHRRDQRRPQTLPVDRTPKPHPRGCQTWEANVRVDPLATPATPRAPPGARASTSSDRSTAASAASFNPVPLQTAKKVVLAYIINRPSPIPLSCLLGDDEVAEIGRLLRGAFRPEDEKLASIFSRVRAVCLAGLEM